MNDANTSSASDPSRLPSVMLRLGLVLGVPLVVIAGLGLRPRPVDLLIHNGHDAPVRVAIDDDLPSESAMLLDPHATAKVTLLTGGRHLLRYAVQGSPDLTGEVKADLRTPFAHTRATYVWDVGGALGKVWIVHRGYGTETAPPPERLPLEAVTAVPEGVLPRLDEGFPDQIRETKGRTGGVRSVLWTDHHADTVAPRRALVFLDNRSQAQLRLYADERLLGTAPPHRVLSVGLPPGVQHLRAEEVGAAETVISAHDLQVELDVPPLSPPPAWVWCPLGDDPDYLILSRSYGEYPDEVPPLEPYAPPARFFPVPEGLVPSLDAFPLRVDVPKGQQGALRRVLFTPEGAKTPDARRNLQGLGDDLLRKVLEGAPETFHEGD